MARDTPLIQASGGVATLVHNSITDHVTVLDTNINSTMWIRLDKRLWKIPIVFGLVYNPPDNSPYADISIFNQIENTIIILLLNLKIQKPEFAC